MYSRSDRGRRSLSAAMGALRGIRRESASLCGIQFALPEKRQRNPACTAEGVAGNQAEGSSGIIRAHDDIQSTARAAVGLLTFITCCQVASLGFGELR
jgi:hypothetical protein